MDQNDVGGAWALLDRSQLRLWLLRESQHEPLFATVSGAHLYGFASADSDVDLRGAFITAPQELLGLRVPKETETVCAHEGDLELDWVGHDVRKFVSMMLRHNGYVLEQLFSPLVVHAGPELEELRSLGRGCITRGLLRHYRGFAHGRRKLLRESGATVKHLLYAYRVYLSGIHVLSRGEIEANLVTLNAHFRLPAVSELVERKRAGQEKGLLARGEAAIHDAELDLLEAQLAQAHAASTLPDEPTTADALDDFVRRVRLQRLQLAQRAHA